MMKTLVTGSTGFLGSHIVEALLVQGHEVRALARKTSNISHLKTTGAEIVFGAGEDYDSLLPAVNGVDVVFHAAARVMPGWGEWEDFQRDTVKSTENLLKASADAGISRFIYVSSGTVIGKAGCGDTPADESTKTDLDFNPDTYYDWAKMQSEHMVLDYHKQGKLPVTVVRPCMIYGPRDRLLTDRMFHYVSMPIVLWPGWENARTALVHVSDVAECTILAAMNEQAAGQIYNIAPATEQRFRDFIGTLARAVGKSEPRFTIPLWVIYATGAFLEVWAKLWRNKNLPFLTRSDARFIGEGMYIDGSKARKELGWEQKVSMEDGTKQYVQWRRSQRKK